MQFSEVPRLVSEADFHFGLECGYGHRMVAIGSAARNRVGNSVFLGVHMDRVLQNVNGQDTGMSVPSRMSAAGSVPSVRSYGGSQDSGEENHGTGAIVQAHLKTSGAKRGPAGDGLDAGEAT